LFALDPRFNIEDLDTVAADAITEGTMATAKRKTCEQFSRARRAVSMTPRDSILRSTVSSPRDSEVSSETATHEKDPEL
jgi:hypothetical protein